MTASPDLTVLGMELQHTHETLRQPVAAVVVIKGLDDQGEISYWINKTSDVTRVEAVGMLTVASDEFRAGLAGLLREPDE